MRNIAYWLILECWARDYCAFFKRFDPMFSLMNAREITIGKELKFRALTGDKDSFLPTL
jgi:hypothetical protein